ncbi:todS [Symbiodinium sp. CCMP2592]|nr:todS [Symbiodinium sp. CCMP2592]
MRKGLDQALRGLDIPRYNISIEHSSGRTKDAWLSVVPWRSATGSIVGAVGSFQDAEEVDRRLGEADWIRAAVAEQLDRANAAIFSIDSNLCITEWNYALEDRSGKEKESVAGAKLPDLLETDSRSRAEAAAKTALAGELGSTVQISLMPGMDMVVGFSPQFSFAGKVIGALAVGQLLPSGGVTRSPQEPGTSHAMKAMILHELRSPLHGILGLATTLSQDTGPLQKPLGMIGLSAERVLNLVTNIIDYWNFCDEGKRTSESKDEVVDLLVLAKECISKCEAFKDKKGKPLKKDQVQFTQNLQSVTISGDAYQLSQMMIHILMNAFKFSSEGEVTFTVEKNKETNSAVITVTDTGAGIKPETRDSMFRAFAQEDLTESRKHDGLGVGLALVREVVRIHQGRCTLEPMPGKGTSVQVVLPCSPFPDNTPASATQALLEPMKVPLPGTKPRGPPSSWLGPSTQIGMQINARPSPPMEGGTQTASSLPALKDGLSPPINFQEEEEDGQNLIMSVDDDFVNQEVMRSILEPSGFQVIACMSGSECLQYFDEDNPRPRLLLLDLMMPGLSGFDVLQALRDKFQFGELPVVMVSAKNQSSSVVKGYDLGCADWIHKPFCRQELIARVKSHLKIRDTLLGYRRRWAQVPSQENVCNITEDHEDDTPRSEGEKRTAEEEAAQEETTTTRRGPVNSTALFANVVKKLTSPGDQDEAAGDDELVMVFEQFEKARAALSIQHSETGHSCYVAISTGEDLGQPDAMVKLAQQMMDIACQATLPMCIGVHSDTTIPVIARSTSKRAGHADVFFSSTVQEVPGLNSSASGAPQRDQLGTVICAEAKALCDEAADNRILVSRGARCRLSADVEAEMQKFGLRLLDGGQHTFRDKFYYFADKTEVPGRASSPLRAQRALVGQEDHRKEEEKAKAAKETVQIPDRTVSQLQEELMRTRVGMQQMQAKLLVAEEQARQARLESGSLRQQLQQAEVQAAQAGQAGPAVRDQAFKLFTGISAVSAVAECPSASRNPSVPAGLDEHPVRAAVLAAQLMESKHQLLQARVEHLELDLGFKARVASKGRSGGTASQKSVSLSQLRTGVLAPPTWRMLDNAALRNEALYGTMGPLGSQYKPNAKASTWFLHLGLRLASLPKDFNFPGLGSPSGLGSAFEGMPRRPVPSDAGEGVPLVPEGQSMPPLSGLSGLVGDGIAGLPTGGAGRLENSVQSLHQSAGTIGTTLGVSLPESMP